MNNHKQNMALLRNEFNLVWQQSKEYFIEGLIMYFEPIFWVKSKISWFFSRKV